MTYDPSSRFWLSSSFWRFAALLLFISFAGISAPIASAAEGAGATGALADGDPFQHLKDNVTKFRLPNGLRVLMYRRANAPVFAAQTWVRVGGVNEVPGNTGISHFLEHMAFKGTRKIGTRDFEKEQPLLVRLDEVMTKKAHLQGDAAVLEEVEKEAAEVEAELEQIWIDNEFSRLYQERGADGLNAVTSKDYTQYMVNLPSVAFEFWCWMESDRILHPVFRQFYREREVVLEERRTRFDDSPGGRVYEALLSTAFFAHPNRLPVIGYQSDLNRLSVNDLEDFYRKYYRPDNMVLSIVGDIDPAEARPVIERYFGRIPPGEGYLPEVRTEEPAQIGPREIIVKFDAEPRFAMAYHKPTYPHPDDARFAVLHSLLSSGRSSIFTRDLVQNRQLAISVYSSEGPGVLFPNLFYVGAVPRKGVSSERLRDEIQAIFDQMKETLVSESDLEAAKRRVRVDFLNALPSNEGLADMLAETELLFGDWQAMFKSYEEILATSAEDIRELARKYLNVNSRTFVQLRKNVPE